jgi:beta-galactosidase GanA
MIRALFLLTFLLALVPSARAQQAPVRTPATFHVDTAGFYLNKAPFVLWSGEMHFQRIPRQYWRDRLLKAKAMGLNTVSTYVFWNAMEPSRGKWNFQDQNDLPAFLREAQAVGLYVLVRPGPYVCAEWDMGGLPAWLLRNPDIRLRSTDPRYLQPALNYLDKICQLVQPFQITRGGNVLMMQVENEFGSYGKDPDYLRALRNALRDFGIEIPLFTADGPGEEMLKNGGVAGCVVGLDPGASPAHFAIAHRIRPEVPAFCSEYYPGWLTHWGEKWARTDTTELLRDLEWLIKNRKSWNLYVFHGGTNFDFYAGANFGANYQPGVTSYDYDAPLREDGTYTAKYHAIRRLLAKYSQDSLPPLPALPFRVDLYPIPMHPFAGLLDTLPKPTEAADPQTMEQLGQNFGAVLYRHNLAPGPAATLAFTGLHDYGMVYLQDSLIGVIDRTKGQSRLDLPARAAASTLNILVEGMGRINYGHLLADAKGLVGSVKLDTALLKGWSHVPIPFDKTWRAGLLPTANPGSGPLLFRGTLAMATLGDTYLDLSDWEKGLVWVNGRLLGRYWNWGPQQRLYLPGAFLRKGNNEILILDWHRRKPATLTGKATLEGN